MFSVSRFDPRKEDSRKISDDPTLGRKKRDKERKPSVKRKKKRKRDSSTHREHCHVDETIEKKTSSRITSNISEDEVKVSEGGRNEIESNDSPTTQKAINGNVKATELTMEPTFRVIAPETDGALSSQKKLNGKISAEAFDDLDLTDDVLLASSLSTKEKSRTSIVQRRDLENENSTTAPPSFDPSDEIERALEMTRLPITEAARRWGMANFLVQNLRSNGHKHFFPIQSLVIPDVILAERNMTSLRVRDVCCAAPTGSGKTLAFVLPVLNALSTRRVRRLRALVILPSRDLAQQVYDVFHSYTKGSKNDLRIGLAIGQTDFQAEQKKLIFGTSDNNIVDQTATATKCTDCTRLRHSMDPGNLDLAIQTMGNTLGSFNDSTDQNHEWDGSHAFKHVPVSGISAVDVLVCTPGRLVDHLDNTPGFTLQHLRWLVIDEADRLLSQSYHGWIQRVLDSVDTPQTKAGKMSHDRKANIDPVTHRRSEQDSFLSYSKNSDVVTDDVTLSGEGEESNIYQRIQLRKLLYSATLTKDPQKLSSLRLVNPKYFNANDLKRRQKTVVGMEKSDSNGTEEARNLEGSLYRMPEQLEECTVECTAEQKPIVVLALILERLKEYREVERLGSVSSAKPKKSTIVVFASSLESTHRLTRLLQLLWQAASYGTPPVEFSSALNQHQRSSLMKRCNDPNDHSVSVLVCSDGMSRGMDLASCRAVIHYDVPGMAKTYVHRCGRTARAGQNGTAIALLKGKGQAGQFTRLRRLIAFPERVKKASVKTSLVRDAIPLYKYCVSRLRDVLAAENRNELKTTDPDLTRWMPGNEDDANRFSSDSSDDSRSEISVE